MRPALRELALLFLKVGAIGFGGPAAHIALIEAETVRQRGWFSRDEFLDIVGAVNLIPGPNSTEIAIHIGYRRAGYPGLIVAGVCFILPAAVIVTAIAWVYVRFGSLPEAALAFRSVQPVMIAIVVQALWGLGKSAIKTPTLLAVALGALTLTVAGVYELLVLLAAAAACVLASRMSVKTATLFTVGLGPLFLFFLKIGSVLFGSGYVLMAFLRADLVVRWHWITAGQLLDAIAIGQVTPGPVFTTATFIGYLVAGWPGAAAATVGIFLPAFLFVALSSPFVPIIRKSAVAGAALDGLNVGSLALMAVVTFQLGQTAIVDAPTALFAIGSAIALFLFRINPTWLAAAAAVAGLLVYYRVT